MLGGAGGMAYQKDGSLNTPLYLDKCVSPWVLPSANDRLAGLPDGWADTSIHRRGSQPPHFPGSDATLRQSRSSAGEPVAAFWAGLGSEPPSSRGNRITAAPSVPVARRAIGSLASIFGNRATVAASWPGKRWPYVSIVRVIVECRITDCTALPTGRTTSSCRSYRSVAGRSANGKIFELAIAFPLAGWSKPRFSTTTPKSQPESVPKRLKGRRPLRPSVLLAALRSASNPMLHRRPQHAPFYPTAALSPCCHAEVPTGGEFGTINRFV